MGQTQSATTREVSPKCQDQAALDADPILATLCSCQEATTGLTDATDAYVASVKKYNDDVIEYRKYEAYNACRTQGSCTNYDSLYGTSYQEQYNSFKDESKEWKNTVGEVQYNNNDTSVYCRNDWGNDWYTADSGKGKYNASNNPNYYGGLCKRTSEAINRLWSDKFSASATRPTVNTAPTAPGAFNAQVAISCCAQTLSDFQANKITISDISQKCTAEVNTYFNQYETNGTIPPVTDPALNEPPGGSLGLPIYAIVLIILGVIAVVGILIWVGIRYGRKAKTPTPPAAPPS